MYNANFYLHPLSYHEPSVIETRSDDIRDDDTSNIDIHNATGGRVV